jgi:hypothetical protein
MKLLSIQSDLQLDDQRHRAPVREQRAANPVRYES